MTHSIKQNRKNPMWYFERNYVALYDMFEHTQLFDSGVVYFHIANASVTIKLLEETRYTCLIEIHHHFCVNDEILPSVVFTVRFYSDAKLAEVISYQGQTRIQAKYPYPNSGMYLPDEKKQSNLLLYDWLCTCSRLNYKDNILRTVNHH